MTTIAERFKFLKGYPGAVKEEFTSGVQGLDEAIRSGGNTLLPSMQMRAAPMIPLIRGAAEQVADPLANWYNQMYGGMDETMRQIGIEPPERREVTAQQISSPLTFLLGTLRGKVWKSSLRGSVQKGPTTQQSKQWIADIKRDKGAWAEAKKTGLDKFLEANPKPSQAELISFLDQSGIELTETVKADNADFPDKERQQDRLAEANDRKNATLDQILDYPNKARNRIVDELEAAGLSRYEAEYATEVVSKGIGELTDEEFSESLPLVQKLKGIFNAEELNSFIVRLQEIRQLEDADDSEIIFYMRSSVTREASELVRSFDNDKNLVEFLEEELIRGAGNPTKYGRDANLNLPGGENPTEILIQLPTKPLSFEEFQDRFGSDYDRTNDYQNYLENFAKGKEQSDPLAVSGPLFTGGHFEEPNVLVHARLNDRTVGGVYSKHSEEYQSDWAQAAEKKRRDEIKRLARDEGISREAAAKRVPKDFGYQQPPLSVDEFELEVVSREQAVRESVNQKWLEENIEKFRATLEIPQDAPVVRWRFIGDERSLTPLQDWAINFDPDFSKEDAVESINNLYIRGDTNTLSDALVQRLEQSRSGLPDQPYKDDPFELGWRRHFLETLRDPNTTRMTWTTGDVQKDRYNLAKYIESIDATLRADGRYDLQIRPTIASGSIEHTVPGIDEFDLEDHVGKELADKIVKDFSAGKKYFYVDTPPPTPETTVINRFDTEEAARNWIREEGLDESDPFFNKVRSDFIPITYSGLDLEMGGKFHKFIYDKKVPQYAKEFLKNYRDANGNKIVPKRISAMTEEDQGAVVYDDEGERYFISPDYVSGQFDIIQGSGTEYDEDTDQWMRTFNTLKEAQEGLKDFGEPKKDLWYIDTTPEMEEDFIEGMPLTMDTTKEQPAFA